MRERLAMHRSNATCAACHRIFEPLGLAMENYDATGAWRTEEAGEPIDASGVFVDGTSIDGPASLRMLVMRYSDQYVRNVTEKLLTYALGRGVEYQDMPLVRAIVRETSESDYQFSAFVRSIVQSDPFQMNVKTGAEQGQ